MDTTINNEQKMAKYLSWAPQKQKHMNQVFVEKVEELTSFAIKLYEFENRGSESKLH